MSVLIKGKALPKKCEECLFYGIDVESGCFLEKCYVIRRAGQNKPSWCPLVPVPPHGRLIDADKMERDMSDTVQGDIRGYPYSDTLWDMAFRWIDHQPTIIEAEAEEEIE